MKNDFSFPSAARDVRLYETWNSAPPFSLSYHIYTHAITNNALRKHNKTKTSNRWQNMFVATAAGRSLCVTQSLRSAEITYFSHPTRSDPKLLCVCSSRHTFSQMVYLLIIIIIIIYVQLLKNPCSFSMIYIIYIMYSIVCISIRPFHKINFTHSCFINVFFLLSCH